MPEKGHNAVSPWIEAIRPRTLPLSVAGIVAGSALAYRMEEFKWLIFVPAIVTTLLLQILSNLANDYGDAQKGTDGEERIGPKRMVQSGMLTAKKMRGAIILTAVLALFSGISLLYASFGSEKFGMALLFFLLGLSAIWAAIKYTVGKSAYGYFGFGDVFVLLFFGFASVAGSFFLYTGNLNISAIMESLTIGSFSMGVLHLNNMRDRESDEKSGKRTIAVKLGYSKSKTYFYFLMTTGILASLGDILLSALHVTELLQLVVVIPVLGICDKVRKSMDLSTYNKYLKPLALSTFFYSVLLFLSAAI